MIKPSSLKELLTGVTLHFLSSSSLGRQSLFHHKVVYSVVDDSRSIREKSIQHERCEKRLPNLLVSNTPSPDQMPGY